MAKYTLQQYEQKIKNQINDLVSLDAAVFIAAKSASALMVERVFEDGKDANGNNIGKYDTQNEIWVSDENSPKSGNHKGKPNKKGESKNIKTTYYESYADFRQKIGRESGKVNLRLFGRLQSDVANAPINKEPLHYSIAVGKESMDKIIGNEFRYGKKIFYHTLNERKTFVKILRYEINKNLIK